MSYKIQSEYQYYYDVASELLDEKLTHLVEKFAGQRGSLQDLTGLPANENEILAILLQKCEHFSTRAGKAITKTQDEVIEEWSAVHHLVEGDGSQQHNPQQQGVTTNKNKKVIQSTLADIPRKILQLAELKYKLLQCETIIKNAGSVSQISVTTLNDFDQHYPDFIARFTAALTSVLNGSMFDPNWVQADAKLRFKEALGDGKVSIRDDVKLTIFTSLIVETLKALMSHLDKRRTILRRSASGSSLNNNSNNNNSSGSLPPSSSTSPLDGPSPNQQQQSAASNGEPQNSNLSSQRQSSATSNKINSNASQQQQSQEQHHHLYSSAFLPPYNGSMTESHVLELMTQFYTVHAPEYLASVPYIVEAHRDDFAELFRTVAKKYANVHQLPNSAAAAGGGGGGAVASAPATNSSSPQKQQQQQQQQQQKTTVAMPKVTSQPQLSLAEENAFRPSAEPDKTLDQEYSNSAEGRMKKSNVENHNSAPRSNANNNGAVQVVVVPVSNVDDSSNNGNNNNNNSKAVVDASATATDSSGSNCVVQ